MVGLNSNSFLGLIVPEAIATGFVMKVNPTATSLFWSTYYNSNGATRGAIAINGSEIGYTGLCFGTNFTWGTQSLNVNTSNQGTEVLLARFNRSNGDCIGLSRIVGEVGYEDSGTALAVDASGDYIVGGYCGRGLTFTTNTILATGTQSDFFVAKYSTAVCSLDAEEFMIEGLQLYPNPADTFVSITTSEKLSYAVYTVTGSLVQQGTITSENNSIDVSTLASGCYVISTKDGNGGVKRGKLIKM
jgi:hypothetical protein